MKKSEIIISSSLVPIDYAMVVLAGIAAYSLRFWEPIQEIRPVIFDLGLWEFMNFLLPVALVWTVVFVLAGLYAMQGTRQPIDEFSRIVMACSTAVMILMFAFFFSRLLFDSRFIILVGWVFTIIAVMFGRAMVRSFQHFLYRYGVGVHRVVVLGDTTVAQEIINSINGDVRSGYRVVDRFINFDENTESQLYQLVQNDKFDEILVATPNFTADQGAQLNDFSYLNHVGLKYVADIFDFPIDNFEINSISHLPVIEVKKTRLDGWGKIYKRTFDIIFSVLLIILLSPILIVVAIVIKLDSAGPVFFKYKRIGRLGKPFVYFKFRSMVKDAHRIRYDADFQKQAKNTRAGTPMVKFANDPRITRVGRIIRRFSIDELPELFNVFIGKMSLVGPRPHEIEEVAKYQNHHRKILTINPGMTGMAQVSGRSDLNFEDEIKLDTWYMEYWSPKLDLMILFKTPLAVLRKRKAE